MERMLQICLPGEISQRIQTDKFWVAFPHGVYDPDNLRVFREGERHNFLQNKNIVLTHQGNSVINGTQLGFSLTKDQVDERTKNFRKMEIGYQFEDEDGKRRKRPVSESFTGRFFSLDKVFESVYDGDSFHEVEVDEYHQIDKFQGYRELMGSKINLEKPEAITRFKRRKREWRKMF